MSQSTTPLPATADRVAFDLRERVLSGELPPGTPLRDTALALELGVSRNTVREAFRLLQASGLTEHARHKGTVVASLTADDIRDIYTARRALELRAVDQSAGADPSDLARLEAAVRRSEQLRDEQRWQEAGTASLEFHAALVATLGSPSLDVFMRTTLGRLRLAFATMPDEGEFQVPWIARDREITDLITQGRTRLASDAMRSYLEDSEAEVLASLRRATTPSLSSPRTRTRRKHVAD